LVGYPDAVDQSTPRKPAGKRPVPASKYPVKPATKKQRRNQVAARTLSLERRPPWQSPTVVTISSVAVVAIVLIVIVLINQAGGGNTTLATPVPQALLSAVENPSASVVNAVGSGGQPGEMVRFPASAKLVDSSGKPMVVYVGAEYCPFCAAERWVMVMWLSRFGSFKNLSEIQSSSTDVDANTSTFTFHKATYSSPYLDFSHNEIEDRSQQPLESMTAQVSSIFTKYDTTPFTSQSGQFPFVDIGGVFTLYTTSYDPAILKNLTWDQIGAKLTNPNDPVTKAIVGNANILTAATCIVTGDQPASVCSATTSPIGATIQSIEQGLKTIKTPTA
jgi:thiol-disulfide isomerase/thioredoxin